MNIFALLGILSSFTIVCCIKIVITASHGEKCTWRASTILYEGTCTFMKDCPSAISNLRAGIKSDKCDDMPGGKLIVCCPRPQDLRISEQKCEEYFENTKRDGGMNARSELCGCNGRQGRIVGGRDAEVYEFPYMVALGYENQTNKKQEWLCGGTLISKRFVLTAARCVTGSFGKPEKIYMGNNDLDNPIPKKRSPFVRIQDVIIHPDYDENFKYNDVALLQLAKSVRFSTSVRPACLPSPKERLELNDQVRALGWGLLVSGGKQSRILQSAIITRLNQSDCVTAYDSIRTKTGALPQGIERSQFCASHPTRDTCKGDTGGPLIAHRKDAKVRKDYVVGISSFKKYSCGSGRPTVYTNVQSFLDWIESVVWEEELIEKTADSIIRDREK